MINKVFFYTSFFRAIRDGGGAEVGIAWGLGGSVVWYGGICWIGDLLLGVVSVS